MFNLEIHPFMMGIGWGIGYQVSQKLHPINLSSKKFNLLFIILFLAAWLGAKFFFLLSTSWEYFFNPNFWLGGGYVFYGGLVFSLIILFIFSQIAKIKLSSFDFLVPGLCFGHAIGRIGCFIVGCCFGIHHIPVQLIESLFLMLMGIKLYQKKQQGESVLYPYLFSYGIFRFFIEFIRGDSDRGYFGPFSTSQWVSLLLVIIVVTNKFLKFKAQ